MKRWNGGQPQSYLQEDGQSSCTISSYSGTASTIYTSTGSHISSISLVAAMTLNLELEGVTTEEEQIKHIKSLVREFFGSPWANCTSKGGDMSVLESWLTELGVGWVLHLADGAPAPAEVVDAGSWIRALAQILETIRFTTTLFPDRGSMPMICEEGHVAGSQGHAVADDQFLLRRVTTKLFRSLTSKLFRINGKEEPVGESGEQEEAVPDQVQFAQFFQEIMLKMLAFVDSIAAEGEVLEDSNSNWAHEPYEKLVTLLSVHDALSTALPRIRLSSYSPPSEEVFKIQRDIVSLLAAKQDKTGEAIWSAMEQIWTRIMESMEDGNDTQGSSDIHKATRSVVRYIGFLRANYSSVAPIVAGAARYVPQNGDIPPLDSMVLAMASCLEEKLGQMLQSFTNHSLGFLFLINNLYYLIEQLRPMNCLNFNIPVLTRKINNYIEYYLQVSWSPLLLCLQIAPFRLRRYCSPMPKFDSEFLKTYEVQKFWKVPDPDMREILRRAITKKVTSGLTEYSSDSDTVRIIGSTFTLQELEEMLQELFEG